MWYMEVQGFVGTPGALVIVAATLQAIAHMFTNQLALRVLLLCGTALYLTYYFVAIETPLWPAIFGTSFIGLTTVYGLIRVMLNRSTLLMSAQDIAILKRFPGLEPGVFRRLMKLGNIRFLDSNESLTVTGTIPDKLFYILEGDVEANKDHIQFEVHEGRFIGDVSMVQGGSATATVTGNTKARVIEWERSRLSARMAKDPHLRMAVEALFTRDLAQKLAQAAKVVPTGSSAVV